MDQQDQKQTEPEGVGGGGRSAPGGQPKDDGKFDLRQFVNSTSLWPMSEDEAVEGQESRRPPERSYSVGVQVSGGGTTQTTGSALQPPQLEKEREVLELCDLPGQMVRSVYTGGVLWTLLGGVQALLLWVLEMAAVWTPRGVEVACRFTAVQMPVLCARLKTWTTTTAPRLASQGRRAVFVSAPERAARAYSAVRTVWLPAARVGLHRLWLGLLLAAAWALAGLAQLATVGRGVSHFLGLLGLGLHRCYSYLVVKFRARFPDAFERMVGVAGACERTCVPAVSRAWARASAAVRSAWEKFLAAILAAAAVVGCAAYKVKVAVLGGTEGDLVGSEQGRGASAGSQDTAQDVEGTTLENIVTYVATCGRGFRDGSSRLRCVSPLKHRLRRLTPRSSFLAILVLFAAGFVVTTVLVYNGGHFGLEVKTREKPQPVDWQEYIRASRRPRLERYDLDPNADNRETQEDEDEDINDIRERIRAEGEGRAPRKKGRRRGGTWEDEKTTDWEMEEVGWKQVSDVIGLMARKTEANQTTARSVVHKKILMSQIELLRDAMVDERSRLPVLDKPPSCVGNVQKGEVEDILCIPRPKFLSHVKNPCWYAGPKVSEDSVPELKCLPYFHILGCAKSGTTDLWNRLMSHPHVISNDGLLHKEALWWSWQRYGIMGYKQRHVMTFEDYVDLFQDTARQIRASMESETLHQQILITGEASPPDFWDFRGWTNISQNRESNTPVITTPHLMRHIYPDPKFILMFRDPIDRLYSDYFFVGGGLTSQDFHNDVLATIDILAKCVKSNGLQRCFYDRRVYSKLPVRLPFSCYSLYMQEWLQVFPMENFLLLKLEEYRDDLEGTLKSVMEFLGLGPLKEAQLELIAEEERSRVTAQRKQAGQMYNATREILHQLLDPCTRSLVKMVGMDKFDWSSPSTLITPHSS